MHHEPCVSCGAPLAGRYCAECGERRLEPGDLGLRRYAAEAVAIITEADNRLLRSLRALVARPGLLTAEYVAGRRKPYLRPLQLFLIANVLFFVVQGLSGLDTLTTPLQTHMTGVPYRQLATEMVHRTLDARQIELEELAERFDATIRGQARTLVIIMVPLMAALLLAFFPRRPPPAAQHLVFATHFFAFLMLLSVVWVLVLLAIVGVAMQSPVPVRVALDRFLQDHIQSLLMAAVFALYGALAFRRAYGTGPVGAALRGLLLIPALMIVLSLYRFILFFTTLLAV